MQRTYLYLTRKINLCKWGYPFLNAPAAFSRFFFILPL